MRKKDYFGSLKRIRTSGISITVAAFISALLLSLLCGISYNLWKYEVERIELEEGGWHSRVTGEIGGKDLDVIRNFAHVSRAVLNGDTAELCFDTPRAALEITPEIAEKMEISPENVSYHYSLLSMYLVRSSQDPAPRMIVPLFLLITALASVSLIVTIRSSFAVSMNARLHQLGILSSVGATPRQIRAWLLGEAAALCALPVAAGNLLGILLSMIMVQMTNRIPGSGIPGRHQSVFGYHPLVLAFTLLVTVLTIWISAWMPARRLSRLTPLEAIRNSDGPRLKRQKKSRILSRIFGVEGELAGAALKAQSRALRTASISFFFSFLAFTMMQCFFTLSGISTRETYFERNLNVWDIMTAVKKTQIESFKDTETVQKMPGVRSAVVYQKASAKRVVEEEEISDEMRGFGGFSAASGSYVTKTEGGWLVNAPVVILDDNSFIAYCEQIGAAPRLDGAVVLNRIRDVTNPDFRHPDMRPYVKGEKKTTVLRQTGNEEQAAEIPVIAYTDAVPLLREEYATIDYYELVHFLPLSLWKEIGGQIGGTEEDTYIRVLALENKAPEELDRLQAEIDRLLNARYTVESENRIRKKELNDRQINGMKAFLSGFCGLLAVIGTGSVFSNALGFVRQRRREIARYLSVGMTPAQIRKIFCIEALVIAARPVLLSLPAAALAVWELMRMSYMEPSVFWAEAPYVPVLLFMTAIAASVSLAYFLGWRSVKKIRLAEVLQDDAMV